MSEYHEIKVYRFSHSFQVPERVEHRSEGPVPILNDAGKIIGFASLHNESDIWADFDCIIDPANPERLELETGSRLYWLDAAIEYRGWIRGQGPTLVYIKSLKLTTEEIEDVDPINKKEQ